MLQFLGVRIGENHVWAFPSLTFGQRLKDTIQTEE
jgi:hypothetical protein